MIMFLFGMSVCVYMVIFAYDLVSACVCIHVGVRVWFSLNIWVRND